jgi:membrane-associated phospholipid phosphatase
MIACRNANFRGAFGQKYDCSTRRISYFRYFTYIQLILCLMSTIFRLIIFLGGYLVCFNAVAASPKQGFPDTTISPVAASDSIPAKVYHVKWKYELPAGVGFMIGSSFGFKALDNVAAFKESDLAGLNPQNVNAFDRPIIFMNPAGFQAAHKTSNLFLNISVLSPLVLALDKNIRKDWLDLISLYLVTHAVDNAVYFATTFPIRRARPLTYNKDVPLADRIGIGKSNSFFSGHVSFSSTATFFLVKVYTDYHQIKGWNRILLYGAASVPPALVGYYRMKAGKHFKTDVITGFVVGAASGILVPEWHRNKHKIKGIALEPFYTPGSGGVTLRYSFH